MSAIAKTAEAFFTACETGKGWEACKVYCTPDATFAAQAGMLAEVRSLAVYTDWIKDMFGPFPDGRYEVKAFATDEQRGNVCAYAVYTGSHTGPGAPVAPTGKTVVTDYVYVMQFSDGRISHMTKIWNDGFALKQVGWG